VHLRSSRCRGSRLFDRHAGSQVSISKTYKTVCRQQQCEYWLPGYESLYTGAGKASLTLITRLRAIGSFAELFLEFSHQCVGEFRSGGYLLLCAEAAFEFAGARQVYIKKKLVASHIEGRLTL